MPTEHEGPQEQNARDEEKIYRSGDVIGILEDGALKDALKEASRQLSATDSTVKAAITSISELKCELLMEQERLMEKVCEQFPEIMKVEGQPGRRSIVISHITGEIVVR